MKQLLVNADDLGLSAGITNGILMAHRQGIVTSTSIVASGNYFDESIVFIGQHPSLGVGIHLTLIEEKPVSQPAALPTLAPGGTFPPSYGALVSGLLTGRIHKAEIEIELRAQIEKCLRAGLTLTHLDSHQHVHALPALFRLVLRIAAAYKIPAIRIPRDWPHLSEVTQDRFLPKLALCALSHLDAVLISRNRIRSTDHFAGLFESGDLTEERLLRVVNRVSDGITELVCHPAQSDVESLSRYGHWHYNWTAELTALTSPNVRQAIQTRDIQLISYANLAASG